MGGCAHLLRQKAFNAREVVQAVIRPPDRKSRKQLLDYRLQLVVAVRIHNARRIDRRRQLSFKTGQWQIQEMVNFERPTRVAT